MPPVTSVLHNKPMSTVTSHISAALYWLGTKSETPLRFNERQGSLPQILDRAGSAHPYTIIAPENEPMNGLLHVLAPAGSRLVGKRNSVRIHYTRKRFPSFSLGRVPLQDDQFVVSPELCFLQVAELCDLQTTIRFGSELCSLYYRDPFTETLVERRPLTSAAKIKKYLQASKSSPGIRTANAALPWLCERARSPREIELYMAFVLPNAQGGSHLEPMLVNGNVPLNRLSGDLDYRNHFECDFLWSKKKVIVEYDSEYAHKTHEARARDESKKNALQFMGYKVITVLPGNLHTFSGYKAIEKEVAKALNQRLRPRATGFAQKQRNLWHWLFSSSDPNIWLKPQ